MKAGFLKRPMKVNMNMYPQIDSMIDDFFRKQAGRWADLPKGVTGRREVFRAGNMKLFKFDSPAEVEGRTPMLFVPSLINRWYILDLTEETSLVKPVAEKFPTYMIDWGYPGCEASHLPFEHFYKRALNRIVKFICRESGHEKINMLGYCIGGTLSYLYSCIEPERVNKVILLASPINFEDGGISGLYAKNFPTEQFLESMESMPGGKIAEFFNNIQPFGVIKKMQMFQKKHQDEGFVKMFVAMERWIADDGVNFPAKAYYDFIGDFYGKNKLAKNELTLSDGTAIDAARRTAECLILNATADHIVPVPATALPAADAAPRETLTYNTGHIGITVGKYGAEVRKNVINFLNKGEEGVANV